MQKLRGCFTNLKLEKKKEKRREEGQHLVREARDSALEGPKNVTGGATAEARSEKQEAKPWQ